MNVSKVFVTKPYLPPLEEVLPYLEQIWASRVLTNAGPFHSQLEHALSEYLKTGPLALFANATLALVTALQALRITGEVITTPYSFVATSHALLWNGIRPVFVDIEEDSFNINPDLIEAAITPQTTAILAVHCYGRPCPVDALQRIADTYNLRLIFDAAHAFAVEDQEGSILRHGDLSILSFHATKTFTTFEGGAIVCPDAKTKQRIDYLKNFGFVNDTTVVASGINGKMNEFCAAIGLVQLQHYERIRQSRAAIDSLYRECLVGLEGISFKPVSFISKYNYGYFPILVEDAFPLSRDQLYHRLLEHGFFPRRYFYPLITDFPMYRALPSAQQSKLPVARKIADRILCLPIFPELEHDLVIRICDIIRTVVVSDRS